MFSSLLLALVPFATGTPLAAPVGDHGDLAWRLGGFEDALRAARAEERLVFVDFWAEWCGWCKRLDRDTFSAPAVVEAMQAFVCVAVDTESAGGRRVAQRYGVGPLPTLLFLDGEGNAIDAIIGYLAPEPFLAEVRRIGRDEGTLPALRRRLAQTPDDLDARFAFVGKLVATRHADGRAELSELRRRVAEGRGYDVDSIEDQGRLVRLWRGLRDQDAAQRHLEVLRGLDPEGRSLPLREQAFAELRSEIDQRYARTGSIDHEPLLAFLAEERHPEVLFEGWMYERFLCTHEAEEARKREQPERRAERVAARRRAEREAWAYCPPEQVASFGHDLAWSWYEESDTLDEAQRRFAADVARRAAAAAPQSAKHQDTLAWALSVAGAFDEALVAARRAAELEPERYRRTLEELEGLGSGR